MLCEHDQATMIGFKKNNLIDSPPLSFFYLSFFLTNNGRIFASPEHYRSPLDWLSGYFCAEDSNQSIDVKQLNECCMLNDDFDLN